MLDAGRLVIAHAGLKQQYHGRASARVRSFALYGDTTGETDEFGLPVRYPWAEDYRGPAMVLYGHTPTPAPEWVNNTMCLDTGCVFGGELTALRYPEKQVVSVPAQQIWYEPAKPFPAQAAASAAATAREPDELAITDVLGKRGVQTRLAGRVTVRGENAAGALEVMSRFAVEPRWLLYLPPTMAPTATTPDGDLLEHPATAFDFYRRSGVEQVICEEKHMGSRAVVLVCRSAQAAAGRFGATDGATGAVYTRTGRSFFIGETTEQFLQAVRNAVDDTGLWSELDTDWLMLDAELLPWSVKAEDLLRNQYAAVGAAATAALTAAVAALEATSARGIDVADLLARTASRSNNARAFTDGPDYTEPANLERLRERSLGHKRSLAAREYALGIESLERAVQREPLWRVHEAVFAVLALESEPVDPRL